MNPISPIKRKGDLEQITWFTKAALAEKGLSPGEDFYFHGANGKKVHGWALRPRGWKEEQKKKYPVVLLIHGGPQGAWEDAWSTRWNFNGTWFGSSFLIVEES